MDCRRRQLAKGGDDVDAAIDPTRQLSRLGAGRRNKRAPAAMSTTPMKRSIRTKFVAGSDRPSGMDGGVPSEQRGHRANFRGRGSKHTPAKLRAFKNERAHHRQSVITKIQPPRPMTTGIVKLDKSGERDRRWLSLRFRRHSTKD